MIDNAMSGSRDKKESSDSSVKCEFYPQQIPTSSSRERFSCAICGRSMCEELFVEHIKSHCAHPRPHDTVDEKEKLIIPEIELSPTEVDAASQSSPFPIIDYSANVNNPGGDRNRANNKVIYTCVNPNNLYYKCEQCSFATSKHYVLAEHRQCHAEHEKVLKCGVCAFHTKSKEMFEMHCRRHRKRRLSEREIVQEHVF